MTKQELNRDIKRLKMYYIINKNNTIHKIDINYLESEFKRLYFADPEFKNMNKQSILFMFRFNLLHKFIPLHLFGIHIDL